MTQKEAVGGEREREGDRAMSTLTVPTLSSQQLCGS